MYKLQNVPKEGTPEKEEDQLRKTPKPTGWIQYMPPEQSRQEIDHKISALEAERRGNNNNQTHIDT